MNDKDLQEEITVAAIRRADMLTEQLLEDMPRLLHDLYDLDVPDNIKSNIIDEYSDIMQIVGEIMSAISIVVRHAYRDTLGKRPK